MSILTAPFLLVGLLLAIFFYWKRLKEDYSSELIFSSAFYIVFALALALGLVSFFGLGQFWFWAALIGFFSGFLLGAWRFDLNYIETFEASGVGLLFPLALAFLAHAISDLNPFSLAVAFVLAVLISLFFVLDAKYKSFLWYRSGRVGFAGLAVLGLLFLLRAVVALLFPFVLSFVGGIEVVISAITAFSLFLFLYHLARSK